MFTARRLRRSTGGVSYIQDVPTETMAPLVKSGKLKATTDFAAVAELDNRCARPRIPT
jgi:hypothetical protein